MATHNPIVYSPTSASLERLQPTDTVAVATTSADPAIAITQLGSGHALLVEDSTSPDNTPFCITATGVVGIGTTTPATDSVSGIVQISTQDDAPHNVLINAGSISNGPILEFRKTRGGVIASQPSDQICKLLFTASEGTQSVTSAQLLSTITAVGTGVVRSRLEFTSMDASGVNQTRVTIDPDGNIYPTAGSTTMAAGFIGIPAAAGTPTGTPVLPTGLVPLYFDSTANKLYAYDGSWVDLSGGGGGGGGGLGPETISVITTNTTASLFTTYIVRSTLTLTLPASPSSGDWVRVVNRSGLTDSIVARNGNLIQGVADDLQLDSPNSRMTLAYVDATDGWVIITE